GGGTRQIRPQGPQPSHRKLHFSWADRRRKDGTGPRPGGVSLRRRARHDPDRHVGIPGEAHRGQVDRRAPRLCRLRGGRPAHGNRAAAALLRIVDIQLERLRARLAERHIHIDLTPEARRHLVRIGYDSAYGARPLRRAIQKNIETQLGRLLLEGKIRDGQTVLVDYDRGKDILTFTPQAAPTVEQAGATTV